MLIIITIMTTTTAIITITKIPTRIRKGKKEGEGVFLLHQLKAIETGIIILLDQVAAAPFLKYTKGDFGRYEIFLSIHKTFP